jgi:hypothetical protein
LQGTAFGVDTPFTFHAVFDAMNNVFPLQGGGFFPVTSFAITIAGHGTFAAIPNIDLNAVVLDPSYASIPGVYAAGLIDHTATSFFLHEYSAASPPFSAPTPIPTAFQGYLGTLSGVPPYVIPLAGGAGDLAINDFGAAAPTASLVAAPEPASAALFAVAGLPLVCCCTVLRRRSATYADRNQEEETSL